MKRASTILKGFLALFLVVGLTGCDFIEDTFEDENEAQGFIEAIAADGSALTVDGIEYLVDADTEFDGIEGLDDLSIGDEVEVEYEETSSGRLALEVELADADDD